jgi:hypothetical protein
MLERQLNQSKKLALVQIADQPVAIGMHAIAQR